MNQYIFLQRIQGPAMLLTFGVCALLEAAELLVGWDLRQRADEILDRLARFLLAGDDNRPRTCGL